MTTTIVIAALVVWGAAIAALVISIALGNRHARREARQQLRQFVEQFPDRCAICSYWRYGYTHGFDVGPGPMPHKCPEEMK